VSQPYITAIEFAIFRARAKIVNLEAGLLALSLGGVAVGTDAPRTFAHLAMGAVMLYMAYRLKSFDRIYRLWREVKHPLVALKNVWRLFPLFNMGWLLLILVATGVLSKQGVLGVQLW
jgi:hypothetical protein